MKLEKLHTIQAHNGPIYAICKGPDGSMFSAGADRIVGNWNMQTGQSNPLTLRTEESTFALHYLEDRQMLFVGSSKQNFHWVDLRTRSETRNFHIHKLGVFGIRTWQADELITYGGEGSVALWNVPYRQMIRQIPFSSAKIRHVNVLSEKVLISCGDGVIHITDRDFNELLTLSAHEKSANCSLVMEEDFVTGGWDGHLRRWDWRGSLIREIPAHNYAIYGLVRWGEFIISASRDKTIKVWTSDLKPIARYDIKAGGHNRSVNVIRLLHDCIVSGGDDGRIILWKPIL